MIGDATILLLGVLLVALFIQEMRVRAWRATAHDLDAECNEICRSITRSVTRKAANAEAQPEEAPVHA